MIFRECIFIHPVLITSNVALNTGAKQALKEGGDIRIIHAIYEERVVYKQRMFVDVRYLGILM